MALALRGSLEEAEALKKSHESAAEDGEVRELHGDDLPAGRGLSF